MVPEFPYRGISLAEAMAEKLRAGQRRQADAGSRPVLRDRDLREFHLQRAVSVAPAVVTRLA